MISLEHKKEHEIDFIRTIAILFVILSHYLWFPEDSIVNFALLLGVVGNVMFFFVSGYVINLSNKINSVKDISSFFKKRIIRIFPLYWLSLILYLYLYPTNNLFLITAHFLGLQLVFSGLEKRMIWFIGAITVYYALYPLIIMKTQRNRDIILRSGIIFLILFLLRIKIGLFNANIFAYLPIFLTGVLTSNNKDLFNKLLSKIKNISAMIIIACLYWVIKTKPPMLHDDLSNTGFINMLYVHIPKVVFGVSLFFMLYWIANKYIRSANIKNIIEKCAVASYSIYLFHGFAAGIVYNYLTTILSLPILFIVFYYIQIGYDKIIYYLFMDHQRKEKEVNI